jgi:large subunit ribosomal protein L30e
MMEIVEEIKKALVSGKIVIGSKLVLEHVKKGTLERAFISTNIEENLRQDLVHYATMTNIPVIMTNIPRDELGTLCKKPFAISALGVTK